MRIQRLTKRDKAGFVTVRCIRILQGGIRQNFAPDFLAAAMKEGWCRIDSGRVLFKGEGQTVYAYSIMRGPGTYCAHCNMRLQHDEVGLHLATHEGATPNAENPSGYRVINHYECMRV